MKFFSLDIPTRLTRLASNPGDDQDTVLKKSALVITSLMVVVAAAIWGIIYVLNSEPLAGAFPRGNISVKGRGEMATWQVVRPSVGKLQHK